MYALTFLCNKYALEYLMVHKLSTVKLSNFHEHKKNNALIL